jgi:hypothetical protein
MVAERFRGGGWLAVYALSHVEEPWLGMVNRNALIVALEPQFSRVQIFGDELALPRSMAERRDE